MPEVNLGTTPLRELNAALHSLRPDTNERHWIIDHPAGRHAVAAGLNATRPETRGSPDRARLEEVANRSGKLGFTVRKRKLL